MLPTIFEEILPSEWAPVDGPPFRFAQNGRDLEWEPLAQDADGARYRCGAIELGLTIRREPEHRAVVVALRLRNTGSEPSAPFTRIQPLHLRWRSAAEPRYIRTIGGGLNESNYPPQTLREHVVRADGGGHIWMEQGHDGRSSNDRLPLMTVACGDGAVTTGLEWSGMWWMEARTGREGEHRVSCHIPVAGLVLAASEELALPAAHVVFAEGGLDAATNACRRYIGERIVPTLTDGPLRPAMDYNHWFGLGPDIDEALMRRQVDRAAELGCEHVILDAGWYGGCIAGDFCTGVGNWDLVDAAKFPRGLEPLAEHVREHGLAFGLWFEVERAHRRSNWVQAHPEWFLDVGGDYLHIDLTVEAAWRACVDTISDAVERLDLRWLKLDYNIGPRPFWEARDPSGKYQFAYVERLYALFDELRRRHPAVVLENCASGGRRLDLGTLRHTHVANLTDHTASAEICRFTSLGAHACLPGHVHVIGLPFGRAEVGTTRHAEGIADHDLLCRMAAMPTLYGDIAALDDASVARIRRLRGVYERYADLLGEDVYRLTPQPARDDEDEVVQFVDPAGERSVVLAYPGYRGEREHRLRLRGLDPERRYRIEDPLSEQTASATGAELMADGLSLALAPRHSALRLLSAL